MTGHCGDTKPRPAGDRPAVSAPDRYPPLVGILMGVVVGTAMFWVGLVRLVVLTTRFTIGVIKGNHPARVLARMTENPKKKDAQGSSGELA